MRRLFFGLEVPAHIKQRVRLLHTPVSGARWQSSEQLHITLLFLGNMEQSRVVDACAAARDLPIQPFEIELRGLGCFGQPHTPRHLWTGVQPLPAITGLQEALTVRMTDLGFVPEIRAFCPHVTLARFGKQPGSVVALLEDYRDSSFGQFTVAELVLFESKRGEHGSVYTVLERFTLPSSQPGSQRGSQQSPL